MLFGKHVLLPIIGYTLFAWLTALCKNLHNFVAPLFIVSVPIVIVLFIAATTCRAPTTSSGSAQRRRPCMAARRAHAVGRFNAGEKVWFWGGVVGLLASW